MPRTSSSRNRTGRLVGLLTAAASLGLASLLFAAPASAHEQLAASDPAAGGVVETLPAQVSLTFSADLLVGGDARVVVIDASCPAITDFPADTATSEVTVTDETLAGCTDHAVGDPTIDGAVLTQQLDTTDAPSGDYAIIAGVVYGDTHAGTWAIRFSATSATAAETGTPSPAASSPESTTATPQATASATAASPADGSPADRDSFLRNLPWIIGGVVVIALGGALVAILLARARKGNGGSQDG